MTRLTPHPLWIGHAGALLDPRVVTDAGIEAVVQLAAEEPPAQLPRDLIACRFPLLDSNGNRPAYLGLAVKTVAGLLARSVPALVGCGMGLSRSSIIAAAALALHQNRPLEECLRFVTELHPTDVSPGLWNEVEAVFPSLAAPPG
jgi:protein-tyrosine phosphatase